MKKIIVIGELCRDIFIYGNCERMSPEAPVPIFIPMITKGNDGMAGNVVQNLKSLSNNVIEYIHQTEKITKTRFVDNKSNHMFLRVDEGEENIGGIELDDSIINYLYSFDVIIVSDYNKGFLNNDDLIEIGKLPVLKILDTKRKLTKEIVDLYDFIKLNEYEYKNNSHISSNQNIITTLGSRGCMYQDKIFNTISPKETIDVSGAGDTFTSAFIIKLIETNDIELSINFANEMASIVVSKRGVTTIF
jgi:D-beta-D-heptose 7-phosphate kinase/D-beta-D-heptose 1-phosphate adenosyltransferase